ncbi:MAG: hypothetical protein JSW21_02465 [Gammaproteobacteria bacterium]|nr:MAG: hypothetical protein JSW21_02465 [Gammaproteobacteria bacterium]
MMTASTRLMKLRDWVREQAGPVDDDSPLLESRLINSLQLVELVLLIEELTGRPIRPDQLLPASFRSIRTIYENFLGGQSRPEEGA